MLKTILAGLIRLSLVISVAALVGCKKNLKPEELSPDIASGGTYYTQFTLFQERDQFRTTNYRTGSIIPINSEAKLVSINKKEIVVHMAKTGRDLTIVNIQKHTNDDVQQAFRKILGKTKVNLSQFPPEVRQDILTGQVHKGMTRKAVLAALGYPPQLDAFGLEGNTDWTYWAARNNRFIVRFKGDRVQEIIQ